MEENKRGRKKVPDHLKAKNRTIRMTDTRWDRFKELGGVKWLIMMINKEKL
jgi:hypothetical protein